MSTATENSADSHHPLLSLGIVGGGRAAWFFAQAWKGAGWPLTGCSLRAGSDSPLPRLTGMPGLTLSELVSRSGVLLLAVSDRAIPSVADQIRPFHRSGTALLHASGSLTSDVFAWAAERCSIHPLRSLPPVGAEVDPGRTLLVCEGSTAGLSLARRLASTCGARFAMIAKEDKPLYHAAAVFGANYVAALLEISSELMRESGIDAALARDSIADLARSAIGNWSEGEGAARFTGPVARGEAAIVSAHLEALTRFPHLRELYRLLAARVAAGVEADPRSKELVRSLSKWLKDQA